MDGWKPSFFLGCPVLRCYVSFREGRYKHTQLAKQLLEKSRLAASPGSEMLMMWSIQSNIRNHVKSIYDINNSALVCWKGKVHLNLQLVHPWLSSFRVIFSYSIMFSKLFQALPVEHSHKLKPLTWTMIPGVSCYGAYGSSPCRSDHGSSGLKISRLWKLERCVELGEGCCCCMAPTWVLHKS